MSQIPAKCRLCGKDLLLEIVPNDFFPPETLACIAICNDCQDRQKPVQRPPPPVKPFPAPSRPPARLPHPDD